MTETAPVGDDGLGARVGELHRLTILFCDVVGSTELSERWEPESYRELMTSYRTVCREVIESEFEGHIVSIKGDGVLSVFGFPVAHENDAERAVRAGLALVRAVDRLSRRDGTVEEPIEIRVGIHNGPLYVDLDDDDVYGLAANVGARLQTIAEPGTVVLSEEVRRLVEDRFEIVPGDPQLVKGVTDPLQPFRVVGERRVPVQRSWGTPLVERDAELESLRTAWAQAGHGSGGRATGVLLCAEAGVGKSRLVAAFAEEVTAAGARVLELHGSPFHVEAGFHPVRSLIEYRCAVSDDADPATRLDQLAAEVASIGLDSPTALPLLAALAGIPPGAGYEPVAAEGPRLEEQIAEAARSYVIACVAGGPTLIVAENLHWFDAATRGLLKTLAESQMPGVLILGTSRNREDGAWEVIELASLTQSGRLALIDALHEGLAEEDRLALAARSGGIPLYVEELVRAGPERGLTDVAAAAPVPGSVPAALYEPLVARLYETPSALPVAATAAAAGQEVDRSLLAATITLPPEELGSTLQALLDAQILELVAGRRERYQFRHELLREVAYELQPPSWRRKVHSRLCDLLTLEEPGDWLVVASHFERAERYEEAADAYRQTAEQARRRGALEEARADLARAIGLIQPLQSPKTDLEVDLRLRRGFLAMSLEGVASTDAAADYECCLALTEADPRGDAMFSTLISLWAYHLSRAELQRARELSTILRSALGDSRGYFQPQNLAGFGMLDWFEGSFPGALDTLAQATHELAAVGDHEVSQLWFVPHDATSAMHVYLAVARFMAADLSGADASLARCRAVAETLDFPQGPWSIDYAHWFGSWTWIESGRVDEARAAVGALLTSSALHGFGTWQLIGATHAAAVEGLVALGAEDPDPAALAEQANALGGFIELWKALELLVFLPFYLTVCGALLAASGDRDGARRRYEESLALAADTGMRFYDAETTRRVAHLSDEPDTKLATLEDALELARAQGARPFELRIALDLHELIGERALQPLERALGAFPHDASTVELEKARARVSTPR